MPSLCLLGGGLLPPAAMFCDSGGTKAPLHEQKHATAAPFVALPFIIGQIQVWLTGAYSAQGSPCQGSCHANSMTEG